MSTSATTIDELLAAGAEAAAALSAPGGVALTFANLRKLAADTRAAFNARGIGRNDRVAIVLDNGPEMAAAFVAITSGTTSAPLNPGYRTDEFEFHLVDLSVRVLLVAEGKESPAVEVARKLKVPVVRLVATPHAGAGSFTLQFPSELAKTTAGVEGGIAQPDDVALVLHTSGFSPQDRGLNIMPLFHIHGLIAGILAPLSAGGEVCCTPGFNALKFFGWMAETHPTWYTAVPTMHQAIVARSSKHREVIKANPLRLIRSSSSSLPPQVIRELERAFGAPVIEAYGMTEAAHQMASNPLPPTVRKPGTVGRAAGPEMAIIDFEGRPVEAGVTGEIGIRGDNVMGGYENHPQADGEAFVNGWFRTGDQGMMDADGYISITGRLKEIINRGGEKISPREVDEVLMDHAAVAQCVTFAVPHGKLGEEVAAAVVLREGAAATEKELQQFVTARLADYKVPRKILILTELPKGATGKLQRIGLAQKLGLG